mgnify:CR=1 FL=1
MAPSSFSTITVVQLPIILYKDGVNVLVIGITNLMKTFQITVKSLKVSALDTSCCAGEASVHNYIS